MPSLICVRLHIEILLQSYSADIDARNLWSFRILTLALGSHVQNALVLHVCARVELVSLCLCLYIRVCLTLCLCTYKIIRMWWLLFRSCTLLTCTAKGNASIRSIEVSSTGSSCIGSSKTWDVCTSGNIFCSKVDGNEKFALFGGWVFTICLSMDWNLKVKLNMDDYWNVRIIDLFSFDSVTYFDRGWMKCNFNTKDEWTISQFI